MIRWLGIAVRHLRFINLSFWRNPAAAFFTVAFPLMLLMLNSLVFGAGKASLGGTSFSLAAFQVVGMSVYGLVGVCFTNLVISLLFDRDQGRLKRIQGTPTPASAYVAARMFFSMCVGFTTCLLCVASGILFFGVHIPISDLILFFCIVLFGGAALSAVALAAVPAIPNSQAGPAIVNALVFPILFISGVFYPTQGAPGWINVVSSIFPIRPLAKAATGAFFGTGVSVADLSVILVWGIAGAILGSRFFRWQPAR